MNPERGYLAAFGTYSLNVRAARENLRTGERARAAAYAGRAAANIMQKLVYGSIMSVMYSVNNDPDTRVVIDRDFEQAYGPFVGAAVGELRSMGEPLPPSFALKAEAIAKNATL